MDRNPRQTDRFHVSASYFMLFFCMGAFSPFHSLFLFGSGWSGVQVGLFASVSFTVALLTQPLWGVVADTLGDTRRVYTYLLFSISAVMLVFGLLPVSSLFFLLAASVGLLMGPLNPLLDSLALQTLKTSRNQLGSMRLWGSLSFALCSSLMGVVFAIWNRSIFFAFAGGALVAVTFARQLQPTEKAHTTGGNLSWQSLRNLMSAPLATFLTMVFLLQLGHGAIMNFLSIMMAERGASSAIIGYTWSAAALVEIPVFFLTGRLLNRFSPVLILSFGAFLTSLRILLLILAPTPVLMLLAQAIDGISFPFLLVPGVIIVYELVPEQWRTTGQTVYAAFGSTLPRTIGSVIGGRILDVSGTTTLLTFGGTLTFMACCALLFWNRSFVSRRRTSYKQGPTPALVRGQRLKKE